MIISDLENLESFFEGENTIGGTSYHRDFSLFSLLPTKITELPTNISFPVGKSQSLVVYSSNRSAEQPGSQSYAVSGMLISQDGSSQSAFSSAGSVHLSWS